MSTDSDGNYRGLAKLMLKLPVFRGRLQMLSIRNEDFLSLCGAFEEASVTLDRLRREDGERNRHTIEEYENLCLEVEQEIINMCVA
jgi:hypothetical protein